MKLIPVGKSHFAKVDDEDFERLSKFKWWPFLDGHCTYASRNVKTLGKWTTVKMHHEVMPRPKGKETDHKDRDGLNNQKSNLRTASRSQNRMNSITPGNQCGYKGVCFDNRGKRKAFWARVRTLGKVYQSQYFVTAEEAATAYNKMASRQFGEFANLNQI